MLPEQRSDEAPVQQRPLLPLLPCCRGSSGPSGSATRWALVWLVNNCRGSILTSPRRRLFAAERAREGELGHHGLGAWVVLSKGTVGSGAACPLLARCELPPFWLRDSRRRIILVPCRGLKVSPPMGSCVSRKRLDRGRSIWKKCFSGVFVSWYLGSATRGLQTALQPDFASVGGGWGRGLSQELAG
jgi:hypothetical protein